MERLQKFLSRAGAASRRHAEAMIVEGRVKVNGKVATVLGTQVDAAKDLVLLDGKLVSVNPERRYFLFYKPPGVVTTLSDPEGRPSVGDYAKDVGGRVFPVGRLDYDAEGALLLTDDGDLANKLMHPSHQVPRVYLAKVKGVPDDASLQKLVDGVRLEDGMAHAVLAQIFEKAERNTWVKIVVTEGRQHLVKRLFAAIGHPVVRLYRPAHAGLPVHGLKPGELRSLSNDEIRRVKAAADGDAQPEPRLTLPARRHGHAAPGFEPEEDTRPEGRRSETVDRDDEREEESAEPQEELALPREAAPEREERAAPRAERRPFAGRPSAHGGGEGRKERPDPKRNREERVGKHSFVAKRESGPPERGGRPTFAGRPRDEGGRSERGGKPGFGERSGGETRPPRGGERSGASRFGARDQSSRSPRGGERAGGSRSGARDEGRSGGGSRFGARDAGRPPRGGKPGFGERSGGSRFGARDAGRPPRGGKPGFGERSGGSRFGARDEGRPPRGDAGGRPERGGKPGFGTRGKPRFGARDEGVGDKRFGARDEAGGKRRFGGDERPARGRPEPRKEGPPVSKPFPGERGFAGSGKRKFGGGESADAGSSREARPRSRFGGEGGPRSDGARGFGPTAARQGERASGPRRTGPGAKPGGFKKGGPFKGGRKGPGGAGGGRSSPRKPRGSW